MAGKTNYFGHKLFAMFSEQRALRGELKKEKAMLGSANQRGWPKLDEGFKRGMPQILTKRPSFFCFWFVFVFPFPFHIKCTL